MERILEPKPIEELEQEIIDFGKECAVGITGFIEDADGIKTMESALLAIRESVRLGLERNNELNKLRLSLAKS